MGYTDSFLRAWASFYCPSLQLYTEMIPAAALACGNTERQNRFLSGFTDRCVVQLGGSDPEQLAHAARVIEDFGYVGVNLNVGCPSFRVQSGAFGACLMKTPERVVRAVEAMQQVVSIPVSVKTRVGVDEYQGLDFLIGFVAQLKQAGCQHVILHARRAILNLNPKGNRSIPPLEYEKVYAVKAAFPELKVELNGGVADVAAALAHLQHVDGIMIGRALLADFSLAIRLHNVLYPDHQIEQGLQDMEKVRQYLDFAKYHTRSSKGKLPMVVKRPFLIWYRSCPGAKKMRNSLQQAETWDQLESLLFSEF